MKTINIHNLEVHVCDSYLNQNEAHNDQLQPSLLCNIDGSTLSLEHICGIT